MFLTLCPPLKSQVFCLEKIEALEDKIKAEMATLKEKMVKMEEEIETFSDLDKLRREAEEKRR